MVKYVNSVLRWLPFLLVLPAVIAGMYIDVMDIDSSQYAAMSKEMLETGNFLKVYNRGEDYLDKPPLLFWVSSLMYAIFGVSHFVFRIIPVLVSFLGVYATYRFTALHYNDRAARYAAIVFASCQAFFLMNHDVRTDTMLTGFTITAIWLLSTYHKNHEIRYLILGFGALGLSLLAKGPIGLMVPVLGILPQLLIRKDYAAIFDPKYLIGVAIVAVMLLPMCIGLYQQFDAYSDKESGLYFYFWKQSFGRLTGESEWSNNPPPTFLLENFLWSYLPWILIFFAAFFFKLRVLISGKEKHPEIISFFGFILPFIALSTSKYQLPHYIFILFPLASVMTGDYLDRIASGRQRIFRWTQGLIMLLIILVTGVLGFWAFRLTSPVLISVLILFYLSALYLWAAFRDVYKSVILPSVVAIAGFNVFMNVHFYPQIMQYQSGSIIGKYISTHPEVAKDRFYIYGKDLRFYAIDFYSGVRAPELKSEDEVLNLIQQSSGPLWIYTDSTSLDFISSIPSVQIEKELSAKRFHISTLNAAFLNPDTRDSACHPVFLLKVWKTS